MRLHTLLSDAGLDAPPRLPDLDIAAVQDDSRRVRPGDLFVARPGAAVDGVRYVRDAVVNGAVAVVTSTPGGDAAVPQIVVTDAAAALSKLANAAAGNPSHTLKVLGVTGTNGKTTTAYLIRHVLNSLGTRCGMIGTVAIDDGRTSREAAMTTPGAVEVAGMLAAMRDHGCGAAAMEISSHALDQGRVSGVRFAGAGFTNLTGDHLDYHGSMDAYAAAKATLFRGLSAEAVAVMNADSPAAALMRRDCLARVVTFGIDAAADYRATDASVTAQGTRFGLAGPKGGTAVSLRLIGRHNIENALCAIALCCEVFGLDVAGVAEALRSADGAPGRLQAVPGERPFAVLVDYAHTDDALRNVLTALRPLTRGTLRVIFGCGGDRDRTKRPRMAKVAEDLADAVYVTSDNPRTEGPHAILHEIVAGFARPDRAIVEADRRVAIERAIGDAAAGDVVLIAGKGHENYQIVGATKHPFDDLEEARTALAAVSR